MARFDHGYRNIEAVTVAFPELLKLKLSIEQIVEIAANSNGHQHLEMAKSYYSTPMSPDIKGVLSTYRQKPWIS